MNQNEVKTIYLYKRWNEVAHWNSFLNGWLTLRYVAFSNERLEMELFSCKRTWYVLCKRFSIIYSLYYTLRCWREIEQTLEYILPNNYYNWALLFMDRIRFLPSLCEQRLHFLKSYIHVCIHCKVMAWYLIYLPPLKHVIHQYLSRVYFITKQKTLIFPLFLSSLTS